MDKYKQKILAKFLSNMDESGTISKEAVLTLEGALGANIVTSNVNIQELSSFPSRAGFDNVYQVINTVVTKEKLTLNDFPDINKAISSLRSAIYQLKAIRSVLTEVTPLFTADIKAKMLDSRERYSFYDEKGNLVKDSYDILEDYTGPRSLLFNYNFISSWTNIPTESICTLVNGKLPLALENAYNAVWYDPSIYGLASLLVNNEFSNLYGGYNNGRPYSYTIINGRSYISILENAASIIELISEVIDTLEYKLSDLIGGVNNSRYVYLTELSALVKSVDKFNAIFTEDKSTLVTFKIMTHMLSQ